MANQLFTVGYEGRSIESFLSTLETYSIDCILDVRELPLSRKRGFSKTALKDRLAQHRIRYIHLKELGSPRELRKQLKATGNYERFFCLIDQHLSGAEDAIETAYRYVSQQNCCILCFEKLPTYCHRSIVAKKIKERDGNGLQITNL